jgi:hypothetical protein
MRAAIIALSTAKKILSTSKLDHDIFLPVCDICAEAWDETQSAAYGVIDVASALGRMCYPARELGCWFSSQLHARFDPAE